MTPLQKKLQQVRTELNSLVLEREDETTGILLSVLSGGSALFLGDVGTAKTMHIQLASTMLGMTNFDILMSETVKPEQIFGPTDIPALARGVQQTKYVGYAPDAEILFFDEIFKANATVLNPLLWLINEHKFRNGDKGVMTCPVRATFAASNEIPTEPILKAIYDRLLLRYNVSYLKDETSTRKLIASALSPKAKTVAILTSAEVDALRAQVRKVKLPDDVRDVAIRIRRQVEMSLHYQISDRRFVNAFKVMQASALLKGNDAVELQDVEVLANILWNELAHIPKVQAIVYSNTSGDTSVLSTLLEEAVQIRDSLHQGGNIRGKLRRIQALYDTVKQASSRYAKQVTVEIRAIGLFGLGLLTERKKFTLLEVTIAEKTIFKVNQTTAMVWSTMELRKMGFHTKRKANYWYSAEPIGKIKARLKSVGIEEVIVSKMQ